MHVCQFLPGAKVPAAARVAARAVAEVAAKAVAEAAVWVEEEAGGAGSVQAPADSVSARPAVIRCRTSRVPPVLKLNVLLAGP